MEAELRSRRAQFIYDRNDDRTRTCTKQTSSEEVKTSPTQRERRKGICMEGYPEKYHTVV